MTSESKCIFVEICSFKIKISCYTRSRFWFNNFWSCNNWFRFFYDWFRLRFRLPVEIAIVNNP